MKEINLAEFKSALESDDSNAIFIDVRTTAEYKTEHIDKVQNIPLDEVEKRVDELKPAFSWFVSCSLCRLWITFFRFFWLVWPSQISRSNAMEPLILFDKHIKLIYIQHK